MNIAHPVAVSNPHDLLNYLGIQYVGQRGIIWHNFSCQKKWFNNTATMNSSLIDRFLTLLKRAPSQKNTNSSERAAADKHSKFVFYVPLISMCITTRSITRPRRKQQKHNGIQWMDSRPSWHSSRMDSFCVICGSANI